MEIGRLEAAGGMVLVPKILISEEIGQFVLFLDGVTLHSYT
jgi:hypothetical protein